MAEQMDVAEALGAEEQRQKGIMRASLVAIVANVALAGFKAAVGALSGSIAIVLDAVNNLSDAASSVITIVGTRLASKKPDRNHPYGHGRVEYLTTIVVAAIVLWAGLTSLVESVRAILHPEPAQYEVVTLAIVAVAVVAKLAMGRYAKAEGERLNSDALVASGEDATLDAVISASTLAAAAIYLVMGLVLEPLLGAVISVIILKSGYEILRDALSKILGERVDAEVARGVKQTVCEVEGVRGAYDLILTDYGPQRLSGSVHVEVDDRLTAREIDTLTRDVQAQVLGKTGVVLHTVGIYSTNTANDSVAHEIHVALDEAIEQEPYVLQVHGLYVDEELKGAHFDLVVAFDAPDRQEVLTRVIERLEERFPDFAFTGVIDSDISD